ncbi:MAG: hypothetical protein A2X02_09015 [Bacteroidetes bacterium GWF2_29_10]|nr:MAG: hypothetical protein A2X02_09015 [Bacteroidetes bacterium GWF2_29_10]
MFASEIIKKVRQIEIRSRILSNQIFAGEYHTAFKGKGMSFAEVREYMVGDDIRNIDWNVTARFNHPYIKVYEEERELTMMLIIDVSASLSFGSTNLFKKDLITEIAAVLAFSAIKNNDKVGVILFSDKIEKFIPPKKGKTHILRIIKELLDFEPTNKKTNITEALKYFNNVIRKKSISFILSDFMDDNFENALKIANHKHDLILIKTIDPLEISLPKGGLLYINDLENDGKLWIDTSDASFITRYNEIANKRSFKQNELFNKHGIDNLTINTTEDYIKPLQKLFKKRGSRI